MLYGVVKKISFERGFGFIQPQGGKDVYFHATVVQDGKFDHIRPDQPVKYELEKVDREKQVEGQGPRAKQVILIDRVPGAILAPPPPSMAAKHHPRARQRKPTWRRDAPSSAPPTDEAGDSSS